MDVTVAMSDDLARRGRDVLDPFTQNGMGHYKPEANTFVAACLKESIAAALAEVRRGR